MLNLVEAMLKTPREHRYKFHRPIRHRKILPELDSICRSSNYDKKLKKNGISATLRSILSTVILCEMAPIGEMAPGCRKRGKKEILPEYLILYYSEAES